MKPLCRTIFKRARRMKRSMGKRGRSFFWTILFLSTDNTLAYPSSSRSSPQFKQKPPTCSVPGAKAGMGRILRHR